MANILPYPDNREPGQMGWAELVSACAHDGGNSSLWSEFLRRYGLKIRQFIRGTWHMSTGADACAVLGGIQLSDLFQNTIVRLVEKDCAAMKRFSGTTEHEWLAYLAVISRSVVRDSLRRQRSLKRASGAEAAARSLDAAPRALSDEVGSAPLTMERGLLAREVRDLCERSISNLANESSVRDLLIFRLYFDHDMSINQIAQCRGIDLSKAGVERVIDRLKERIRGIVSVDASEAIMR